MDIPTFVKDNSLLLLLGAGGWMTLKWAIPFVFRSIADLTKKVDELENLTKELKIEIEKAKKHANNNSEMVLRDLKELNNNFNKYGDKLTMYVRDRVKEDDENY